VADASRLILLAGYTIPRAVSPIAKCYAESLPAMLEECIIRFFCHAPGEDADGDPGRFRDVVVQLQSGGVLRATLQVSGRETAATGGQEGRLIRTLDSD
jgi:hypothetical protein